MIAQPFKPLWENPTFANPIRTLPTVLTSSLFMLFGLLEVVLACLKWMLFVLIITATFLFGLGLLMMFVLVLVGLLMGSAKEGRAEVREDAKQDVHAERKVEQDEAVLESDIEERATHSPPTFAVFDTSGVGEMENGVEEFWRGASVRIRKQFEKDAIEREREDAKEAMSAAIRHLTCSSEHRTSR